MEELVGHRLEADGSPGVGVGPDGAAARLQRLPPAVADRAVELLTAAAGEHVESLLDIGSAVNGDAVLVLPHLPVGLADLLQRGLTPGEAVTILVPLAGTIERLHATGIAHGVIRVAAVRFDERGAPVLTGFAHAVRRGAGADPGFEVAVAADRAAFRALADTVLRAAGPAAAALAGELASGALDFAALPHALFALADPAPVRLEARAPTSLVPEPPGRLFPAAPPAPEPGREAPRPLQTALQQRLGSAAAAIGLLRGVRLRVWVAAAASLALLAAAVVLLPGRGAAEERAARPSAATRAAAPSPTVPPPVRAVVPREPLAASRMLLAERNRCLAAGSSVCLARVESGGSPVSAEDAAAIAGAVEPVSVSTSALHLRSASGGTAVLTAGDRTVLLIREAGDWRLRDVIGPPIARSTARSAGGG